MRGESLTLERILQQSWRASEQLMMNLWGKREVRDELAVLLASLANHANIHGGRMSDFGATLCVDL